MKAAKSNGHVLYRHYGSDDVLLYVGISLSGLVRLSQHKQVSKWFCDIARVEFEKHADRESALAAERKAIQEEKPRHNICHALKERKEQERKGYQIAEGIARKSAHQMQAASHDDIFHRLTRFDPLYDDRTLAIVLRLPVKTIRWLIESGEIASIEFWNTTQTKKIRRVTGWAVIDWLESQGATS